MDTNPILSDVAAYEDFRTLIAEILRVVAPHEMQGLDRRLFRALSAGTDGEIVPMVIARDQVRSLNVIEVGVLSLHLIAGTISLVEMYRARKVKREEQEREFELQREWEESLIAAGMDAETARQIPVKFSPGVIRFITTQRIRQSI